MISVVIPLYNKELAIEQSLKSVLTQSCDDFEVVIVDDGSTDGSVSIVEGFDDSRIRLFHQENGGPSKARNTGVKHAQGEWIVFLDADDTFLSDALRVMNEHIAMFPNADIIDFDRYFRLGNKIVHQREHPINGQVKNPMCALYYWVIAPGCGHTIYRKELLEKFPYDERIRRLEDLEILMRMLPNANVYSSSVPTEIHNVDYIQASKPRKDINEDYTGYLRINGGFWHRMRIFRTFIEERTNYNKECHKRYPLWYFRYDLLFLYKFLFYIRKPIIRHFAK